MLARILGEPDTASEQASVPERTRHGLRLATWNLQWLNTEGRGMVERDDADLAELARYAERLDPDVVAVQEVSSEEALARIFPRSRYAIHLAAQGQAQKTGFAYRKDLEVRVMPDLDALSEGGLRAGADLEVEVEGARLRLLAVHLKAFCVTEGLDSDKRDCERLAEQVPAIEAWVDARASTREPFVVLGDFNRFLDDQDDLWRELADKEPAELTLRRTDSSLGSLCQSRRNPKPFIDHIVLGGPAANWLVPDSFRELRYDDADRRAHVKLSDHCPILVQLEARAP